jgi:L-rhamnose isomerase
VIGTRATQKAFLQAMLSPIKTLREDEAAGRFFQRLARLEEAKAMPWSDVYNYFCLTEGVPPAGEFISEIEKYERQVTAKR